MVTGRETTRRDLRSSIVAAVAAATTALGLGAVGGTGLNPALTSGVVMAAIAGLMTFLILHRVADRVPAVEPAPAVVSTAVPQLDGDDGFAVAQPVRPDAFAVGWEAAGADQTVDETELQAWDQWMNTLDDAQADSPVWADAPRAAFDFSRWIPGSADHDTVQLPAVAGEPQVEPIDAPSEDVADVVPHRAPVAYPDFARWPDAPWERANAS